MNKTIAIIKTNPKTILLMLFLLGLVILFLALSILTLRGVGKQKNEDVFVLTPEQQEQNKADIQYGEKLQDFTQKYPWYENLPPKNSKYFVAFDDGEAAFYVSLYSGNNPITAEEYKKQLYLDLQKIGVATQSYSFKFTQRDPIQ